MSSPEKFQRLAQKLAGDKFSAFFPEREFKLPAVTNPVTGVREPAVTENVPAMREEYKARQIDGSVIQVGDFKLLAEVRNFKEIHPRTDGLQVDVDGVMCNVVSAEKDPADAMWTMQVRQS